MKSYFNFFHYFLLPTLILITIIISCTPGRIVVQASDKIPEKIFTLDENLKFLAFDERKIDPKFISNYGDKKSRTILFSDSVNTYVENYFNKSFIENNVNDSVKTILVFIDQFKIEESATQDYDEQFKYSFRFSIPLAKDTSVMFRVASKYSNNGNSSIQYDQMINLGLTQCLDSFLIKRTSSSGINIVRGNQTSKNESMNYFSVDKKIIGQNLSDTKEQKIETNYIRNEKHNAIGFTYLTGNKIVGGGQAAYYIGFGKPEGNTLYGYGVGLLFYSVENTEDNIKGYFLGGYVPFSLQYYFLDYDNGPFIGSFAHLMIGQEKIDYGYEDKTNIYIGPNFDLFFGMKFLNSISVDAGFYIVVLAGSDILPNDNGFRINLRIWN